MLGAASLFFYPRVEGGEASAIPGRKPNIIFILIDDMGWKDVGFMGSKYYETPNIDKLASQGMTFTSAYTGGPNCAPSRACLISGVYGPRTGIYTVGASDRGPAQAMKLKAIKNVEVLDTKWISLPKMMHTAGYVSISIGKWHLGDDPAAGPVAQGFDRNIGGGHEGETPSYFTPYHLPNLPDGPPGEYLTDRLTDEAIHFMEQNKDKPFFLYLPHYAVHTPLQGKNDMIAKYKAKPPDNGQGNAVYAAMIESTDQSVGRIMKALDDLHLTDNTIVIFTSDNGGLHVVTSNLPLRGYKGQLYEGGIRVPMTIRWPGVVKPGTICDEPVNNIDYYPTLAEIAQTPVRTTQPVDGVSFVPLLKGESHLQRDALFWHFPCYLPGHGDGSSKGLRSWPSSAVRSGDWKLLKFYEDDHVELYNLKDDIGETKELSRAEPQKTAEMRLLLENWLKNVNAPIPTDPNPAYNPNYIDKTKPGSPIQPAADAPGKD